jgi:hypothetical protein
VDWTVRQNLDAMTARTIDEMGVAEVAAAVTNIDDHVVGAGEGVHHGGMGEVMIEHQHLERAAGHLAPMLGQPLDVAKGFGQVVVLVGRAGHRFDVVDADGAVRKRSTDEDLHLVAGAPLFLFSEVTFGLQNEKRAFFVGDTHGRVVNVVGKRKKVSHPKGLRPGL